MARTQELPSIPSPLHPTMLSPRNSTRRQSFLDRGGANSLHNFASSYQRALAFLALSLGDMDNISPCTSREAENDAENPADAVADLEQVLSGSGSPAANTLTAGAGQTRLKVAQNLRNFHFPQLDETTPLVPVKLRRSSSHIALDGAKLTAPQTVFNAVNTLMGIAMLSLPFGLRLSGWVLGLLLHIFCAYLSLVTAKILGRVLRKHPGAATYTDIAYMYGGARFSAFATLTFVVDLLGASLMLILIFSDSFTLLFPAVRPAAFKIAVVATTLVLSFLPLSVISLVSLVGIVCTVSILVVAAICGFGNTTPGSLFRPAPTSLWPSSWTDLLFSLGIFMAPWGGHPVFPELYCDMRHPQKFARCFDVAFLFSVSLNLLIAAMGYAMFGNSVHDSLTKSILECDSYAPWVLPLICVFLGVLPVCKLALITRPVISVYELHFKLVPNSKTTWSPARVIARVCYMGFLFVLSIAFTSFGKVVAFLGSAICFTICISLPFMFNLKLNAELLTPAARIGSMAGVAFGFLAAVLGTYGAIASTA